VKSLFLTCCRKVATCLPRAEGTLHDESTATTFLFTDIEGSTRLWEEEPERMRSALARHDALARAAVEAHAGEVVKMTGDGLHAAFTRPLDALHATLQLQLALLDEQASFGIPMRIRCGLHSGVSQKRDNDYYGMAVNRAARVMSAAHGGQVLVSQAVAAYLTDSLPGNVALRDLGVVRLRDLAAPERLYQVVHPRLPAEFPPLRSLEGTPNNLPHALSSFIGRERDIEEIRRLLSAGRLVTVLGVGGLGKTRVALQVAAEQLEEYGDGVWVVELGRVGEARRVAQAAASAMSVSERPGRPVEEALASHVRDRAVLVVLDNCEHVVEAAAQLARLLLASGPKVKVLTTSREPLRMTGEASYLLPPLSVPGPRSAVEPAAVLQYEAVRLFVDRATAVQSAFELSADDAPFVAAICHRLDGVPMAIELAAARVRTLNVKQIALRLKDRFRLLTGGDPTALPRQRTLRAMIDWSHDLLPYEERALFRRLAVFAGGWTLEAAEAVCSDEAVRSDDVLELLSRLVEKSLVEVDSRGRYRMLETVREYAAERLTEADADAEDTSALRERHFANYAALAAESRAQLTGSGQVPWLARLDAELENLLLAHEWAGMAGRALQGLAMVGDLKFYWISRGILELGQRVTLEALARPAARERGAPRCRGLFHAGQLSYAMGRFAEARQSLEESLSIARQMGEARPIAAVLQPLGMAALGQGDLHYARACLEEALALARERPDRRELAAALNALAQLYRVEGALNRARPLYLEVLALARELEDRESEAIVQLNRAMVALAQGELEESREILRQANALAEKLASPRIDQCVLEASAGLAAVTEQWDLAARLFAAAEAYAGETGLRRDPADEAFLAPLLARTRQSPGAARFEEGGAPARDEALREARDCLTARRSLPCR
jgi:predicted ATPase/class 3 adenylate cyclase